jgi:hypothetical protein
MSQTEAVSPPPYSPGPMAALIEGAIERDDVSSESLTLDVDGIAVPAFLGGRKVQRSPISPTAPARVSEGSAFSEK